MDQNSPSDNPWVSYYSRQSTARVFTVCINYNVIKVRKSQKQIMVSLILTKKRTTLTILSKEDPQDSEFRSGFFGELRTQ